jgi:hypothetical protein
MMIQFLVNKIDVEMSDWLILRMQKYLLTGGNEGVDWAL